MVTRNLQLPPLLQPDYGDFGTGSFVSNFNRQKDERKMKNAMAALMAPEGEEQPDDRTKMDKMLGRKWQPSKTEAMAFLAQKNPQLASFVGQQLAKKEKAKLAEKQRKMELEVKIGEERAEIMPIVGQFIDSLDGVPEDNIGGLVAGFGDELKKRYRYSAQSGVIDELTADVINDHSPGTLADMRKEISLFEEEEAKSKAAQFKQNAAEMGFAEGTPQYEAYRNKVFGGPAETDKDKRQYDPTRGLVVNVTNATSEPVAGVTPRPAGGEGSPWKYDLPNNRRIHEATGVSEELTGYKPEADSELSSTIVEGFDSDGNFGRYPANDPALQRKASTSEIKALSLGLKPGDKKWMPTVAAYNTGGGTSLEVGADGGVIFKTGWQRLILEP